MKDVLVNTLAHVSRPIEADWTRLRNGIGVKRKITEFFSGPTNKKGSETCR